MTKVIRKIIKIDEDICNGCGSCILGCPEQAIQLVETPQGKKARLVKDIYCDGLGACLGACPTGALIIETRESDPYDDAATVQRIKEVAPELLETHRAHLEAHQNELFGQQSQINTHNSVGCPCSQVLQWTSSPSHSPETLDLPSELRQWPVQLALVSPEAPYFQRAHLSFIADCVPIAYPTFHRDFLQGHAIAICCPKFDNINSLIPKIAQIIKTAKPQSIQVVHMTVPCCFGLTASIETAIKQAGSTLSLEEIIIDIKGEKKVVT